MSSNGPRVVLNRFETQMRDLMREIDEHLAVQDEQNSA